MRRRDGRIAACGALISPILLLLSPITSTADGDVTNAKAASIAEAAEFSGTLIKRVEGRRFEAQVYVKPGRARLEYKYAVRTELGFSTIEIIRLDRQESWFLLARTKRILPVPFAPHDRFPLDPRLPGEQRRELIGEATVADRAATLFEVHTDYNGRRERYYEWVDQQNQVVLKLVSQDRDWSLEYLRIHFSAQPDHYFQEPPGYTRWSGPALHEH